MSSDKTRGLIPFKKGHDPRRNYDGRPKELPEIRDALVAKLLEEEGGKTKFEQMVEALIEKAANGNERCAGMIMDRVWKKLSQDLVLTGKDGQPIEVEEKKTWFIALKEPIEDKPKRKTTRKNVE